LLYIKCKTKMVDYHREIKLGLWTEISFELGYHCRRDGAILSMKSNRLVTLEGVEKRLVRLTNKGVTTKHDVHNIIAKTFIPNPEDCLYVRHINGDSYDNRVENLEWTNEPVTYFSPRIYDQRIQKLAFHTELRQLRNYPGYFIHPDGRVFSVKGVKHTALKVYNKQNVVLNDYEHIVFRVAKLVADTFLENPLGCHEVVYIDGDSTNYKLENLRWDETSTVKRNLVEELQDQTKWSPIRTADGSLDKYRISRDGEVVSVKTKKHNNIVIHTGKWKSVRLRTADKTDKVYSLQELLGRAFLENPNNYEFVAPINYDVLDLRIENLQWWPNPNGALEENWKPDIRWAHYEVSHFGVRNAQTKWMLCPQISQHINYPYVTLQSDKVYETVNMHKLIARNFLPNPDNLPMVNHIDGDHDNYVLDNLEWCTASYNLIHAYLTGLRDGSTSVTTKRVDGEIWRHIRTDDASFNAKYSVSNHGNVENVKGKLLKLRSLLGYHTLTLTVNHVKKYPSVHQLVANAFLTCDKNGSPLDEETYYEVDHINKIRSDNRAENLQFISVAEHRTKDQGKPVYLIKFADGGYYDQFCDSMSDVAVFIECSVATVSKLVQNGKTFNGWYIFLQNDPLLDDKIQKIKPNI
jgi:hypothetical protein